MATACAENDTIGLSAQRRTPSGGWDRRSALCCGSAMSDLRSRRKQLLDQLRGQVQRPEQSSRRVADGQIAGGLDHRDQVVDLLGRQIVGELPDRVESVCYTEETNRERVRAVCAAIGAPLRNTWNGEDGHDGVSIVLGVLCPESLSTAIKNYRAMPDVFRFTDDERRRFIAFGEWWENE